MSAQAQQTITWESGKGVRNILKVAAWEDAEGFGFSAEVHIDTDYDWGVGKGPGAFRGYFTDTNEEDAIYNPRHGTESGVFRYFVPAYTLADRTRDLLKESGYTQERAEREAAEQVYKDLKIAASPEEQGYTAVGVVVACSFRGVQLAQSSVWGTEIDNLNDPYLDDLAREEAEEALAEAKKKLEELRK